MRCQGWLPRYGTINTAFWCLAGMLFHLYRGWMLGFTAVWFETEWEPSCKEDQKFKSHVCEH